MEVLCLRIIQAAKLISLSWVSSYDDYIFGYFWFCDQMATENKLGQVTFKFRSLSGDQILLIYEILFAV
jgi:hypothetical protein